MNADKRAREALSFGKGFLKDSGIESYSLDAEVLLAHVLKCGRIHILTGGANVTEVSLDAYKAALAERAGRKPVAYIIGEREFWSLPFCVDESVLIPRPETELLVEAVINEVRGNGLYGEGRPCRILEIGAGSGCVSVSLAYELINVEITAADICPKALSVAKKNAVENGVSDKIKFVESDLFGNITERGFDVIVSNPPYIASGEIGSLEPEVRSHEPILALDGGADGLDFYKRIAREAAGYLKKPGGAVFLEIGCGQAEAVAEILAGNGFGKDGITVIKDYSGRDRVIRKLI